MRTWVDLVRPIVVSFEVSSCLKALKKIGETMNTNADGHTVEDTKRQLVVCRELLSVWENSMERVSKLCKTSATAFKCIVENVPLTIKLIFEHCRAR